MCVDGFGEVWVCKYVDVEYVSMRVGGMCVGWYKNVWVYGRIHKWVWSVGVQRKCVMGIMWRKECRYKRNSIHRVTKVFSFR